MLYIANLPFCDMMKCRKVFGCFWKKNLTDGEEEDWQFLKCFLTPITNPNFLMRFLKMHTTSRCPQQTQVFGPGMTIDSKFYQGFSFIIKLLESFIVVYYTHQVYKPIAKVHQPVYKKPTNLGSNRFSLFQLFQLKLFVFFFTIN